MKKRIGLTQEQARAVEVLQKRSGPRIIGLRGLSRRAIKGLVQAGLAEYGGTKEQTVKLAGHVAHVSVRKPRKGAEITLYKVSYLSDMGLGRPRVVKHLCSCGGKTVRVPGRGKGIPPEKLEFYGFYRTAKACEAAYQAKLRNDIERARLAAEFAEETLAAGFDHHNF